MKFLTAAIVMMIVTLPCAAQSPAVQRAADDLAALTGRVADHEQRIAALEQRASVKADMGIPISASAKRTYADAYARALATGRPLLVWNGAAVCPPCIEQTADEYVHFVGGVDGCPVDAITVSVPEGGELRGVGVVDRWVGGDPQYGHLPSVRRILQRFRQNRMVTTSGPVTAPMVTAFGSGAGGGWGSGFGAAYPTAFANYGQPVMMSGGGGGGCASCGGSAGRGFFRR